MRLKVNLRTRGAVVFPLALTAALSLALTVTAAAQSVRATTGPMADYPVVVGAAYTINGTAYVPEDVLNYDQVGMVANDPEGGSAITGAHHTLPMPSYVEVTSLATGRTILVRLERRGPMAGTELIALSPGARAQLELSASTPVRVRRVNPPEDQRALLRAGQSAPLRMDTPMSLVEVLKRKLPGQAASKPATAALPATAAAARLPASAAKPATVVKAPIAVAKPAQATAKPAVLAGPTLTPKTRPAPVPPARPKAVAAPAPRGKFTVQAAAFANADNAAKASRALGGNIVRAGKLSRVVTGPFATRGEAEASLAKVKSAGYSDARIQTSG